MCLTVGGTTFSRRLTLLVKIIPADEAACGLYRCIWPAQALIASGDKDVTLLLPSQKSRKLSAQLQDGKVVSVENPEVDVVVLQRVVSRVLVESIPFLQDMGVKIVVEIDDDYSCLDPRNVAYHGNHPRANKDANWNWLARACSLADRVVVTTPALAQRYGGHGRVRVVPNFIPASYLNAKPSFSNDRLMLGWPGNMQVHSGDLETVGSAVSRVLDDGLVGFRFIGHEDHEGAVCRELNVRAVSTTGWIPVDEYASALASLDVGLVPLARNSFSEAKSWLKGLEMAAVGAPFVASRTEPYESLAGKGAGLVAGRPKDWFRHLRLLVSDAGLRDEMSGRGRTLAETMTVEGNAWRFKEAWADW